MATSQGFPQGRRNSKRILGRDFRIVEQIKEIIPTTVDETGTRKENKNSDDGRQVKGRQAKIQDRSSSAPMLQVQKNA